jgi:hypothetical protein
MGGVPSHLSRNSAPKTTQDGGTTTEGTNIRRTLDGKKKGMKIRTGTMKAKWLEEMPEISIFKNVIRIQDTDNNIIELKGDQEKVELGGFQMTTRNIEEPDGKKGFGLGINTRLLNLATFEIEVQSDGNIVLTGRKIKNSKEGQLKLLTLPDVTPGNIRVDALDDNRTIWIRIYYEVPENSEPIIPLPIQASEESKTSEGEK